MAWTLWPGMAHGSVAELMHFEIFFAGWQLCLPRIDYQCAFPPVIRY